MKYFYLLFISSILLIGCRKEKSNPDDLITIKSFYNIDKIRCDTIFAFYIPSGFTPNMDGRNEYWEPKSNFLDSTQYRIDIFDKRGKIIFKSNTPARFEGKRKDGRLFAEQTFGYYIEATDQKGNKYNFKGQFALFK
jgi:gliding motility-associated-like protein